MFISLFKWNMIEVYKIRGVRIFSARKKVWQRKKQKKREREVVKRARSVHGNILERKLTCNNQTN